MESSLQTLELLKSAEILSELLISTHETAGHKAALTVRTAKTTACSDN